MSQISRTEAEIFVDLLALTGEPGYVHAIAQIYVREYAVIYKKQSTSALLGSARQERFIRTEINTLIGLMLRHELDFSVPSTSQQSDYIGRTELLVQELHDAIARPMFEQINSPDKFADYDVDIWRGEVMREPIFYGGESAYNFQYRDFAKERYAADSQWLSEKKGFTADQARVVAQAMAVLITEKTTLLHAMSKRGELPTWLPAFALTIEEVTSKSGMPVKVVRSFVAAFAFTGRNDQFQTVGDFNAVYATPLIALGTDDVLVLSPYTMFEATYDSPFYWMMEDKAYRPEAAKNRGNFTEVFAHRRLAGVFGTSQVFSNVLVKGNKNNTIGEVDVLAISGDRLVLVQAKSKKLTIAARKGNDGQIRSDFAAAVQDAYDQAWLCANEIAAGNRKLVLADDSELSLPERPKEIFLITLVSEHYPSLAFQSRQYLKYEKNEQIRAPFVIDVFLLDALTEMLDTPLRLLSYISTRMDQIERISVSHELNALAFYLKTNMYVDSQFDFISLEDSLSEDLDLAMGVRRNHLPGCDTPEGALTLLYGTPLGQLIAALSHSTGQLFELGRKLLSFSPDGWNLINGGLRKMTRETQRDGARHDFSLASQGGGVTFHCVRAVSQDAIREIESYCRLRKYAQRLRTWVGVVVDTRCNILHVVSLEYEFEQTQEWDDLTEHMRTPKSAFQSASLARSLTNQRKIGRNELCPCGSNVKFKRCCLVK